jgi:hypothetical protein
MNQFPPGYSPGPPAYPPPPPAYPPPPPAYPPTPSAYAPIPLARSPLQWMAYLRTQLEAGQPIDRVLSEMAATGVGQQDAVNLVTAVIGAMRKRALTILAVGVGAVLLGLVVTLATMHAAEESAATSGSGTYVMWFGPIIFGAIAAVYGLYLLGRLPRLNP